MPDGRADSDAAGETETAAQGPPFPIQRMLCRLCGFDSDLSLLLLDLLGLRQGHRQNTLVVSGVDLVGIDAFRQAKEALEGTIAAFGHDIARIFFLLLFLLFSLDEKPAID